MMDVYPPSSVKRSNTTASVNGFPLHCGKEEREEHNRSPTQDAYAHQVFSRSMNYYSFREPGSSHLSAQVDLRPEDQLLGGGGPRSLPPSSHYHYDLPPPGVHPTGGQFAPSVYQDFSIPYDGEFAGPYHPVSDASCHKQGPPVPTKPWKKKRHESVV